MNEQPSGTVPSPVRRPGRRVALLWAAPRWECPSCGAAFYGRSAGGDCPGCARGRIDHADVPVQPLVRCAPIAEMNGRPSGIDGPVLEESRAVAVVNRIPLSDLMSISEWYSLEPSRHGCYLRLTSPSERNIILVRDEPVVGEVVLVGFRDWQRPGIARHTFNTLPAGHRLLDQSREPRAVLETFAGLCAHVRTTPIPLDDVLEATADVGLTPVPSDDSTWIRLRGRKPGVTLSVENAASVTRIRVEGLHRLNLHQPFFVGHPPCTDGLPTIDQEGSPTRVMERIRIVAKALMRAPRFRLPGRPALESFFRDRIIDVIENEERYRVWGLGFPGSVLLHGPPGAGKTFAVSQLASHLGWAVFSLEPASVGSPYIHETGMKIAKVFEDASEAAPSIVIIDEAEAYLASRGFGVGQGRHHLEETGELLRRIQEAPDKRILVVAMTNQLDLFDAAAKRKGRFDHVIEVGLPSAEEVVDLLPSLMGDVPRAADLDVSKLAQVLAGRPLSDVAFFVREAKFQGLRRGLDALDQECFDEVLAAAGHIGTSRKHRPLGFRNGE